MRVSSGERQSMCNVEAWVRLNLKDLILESRISAVTVLVAVVVVGDLHHNLNIYSSLFNFERHNNIRICYPTISWLAFVFNVLVWRKGLNDWIDTFMFIRIWNILFTNQENGIIFRIAWLLLGYHSFLLLVIIYCLTTHCVYHHIHIL